MGISKRLPYQVRLAFVATLAALLATTGMQGAGVNAQSLPLLTCIVEVPGPVGEPGPDGDAGAPGEQGPSGAPGEDGRDGRDGLDGPQGPQGPVGPQGPPGGLVDPVVPFASSDSIALLVSIDRTGSAAYQGAPQEEYKDHVNDCSPNAVAIVCIGVEGDMGPSGNTGSTGPSGEPGPQGEPGQDGKSGAPGAPGEPGEEGDPGLPGEPGYYLSGASPDITMSPVSTIHGFQQVDVNTLWENHGCFTDGVIREGTPTQGPQGYPGPKGDQGTQGPEGAPGQPGENGKDGLPGAPGLEGPRGPEGPKGPTLAIPVVPEIGDAVCEDGKPVLPSVTITDHRLGITYGTPVISDGTVTVTATLTVDAIWSVDELPDGWGTTDDPLVIIFEGEYTEVPCETPATPVTPELPAIEVEACVEGDEFAPVTVTFPDTNGVTYSDVVAANGVITATATLTYGFTWDTDNLPTGWTVDDDDAAVANYSGTYVETPCETPATPVTPELPVVTPAVCENGKIVPPGVELPTTPGITYTKEGKETPGNKVIITATLEDGKKWGKLPAGWTKTSPTTATYTVEFDSIRCDVPTTPTTPEPVKELPNTGAGTSASAGGILLATVAGAALAAGALRSSALKRS